MILAPSILAADLGVLADQVKQVENAGAKWLHIDVMDGHFVPNMSFGIPVVRSIRRYTDMFFDVHLMITDPEVYIREFIKAGADGITFHIEAAKDPMRCIRLIRKYKKQAAIAINPNTPVSAVRKYLDKVDMILVMSVEPGCGGQQYITDVNKKIHEIREIMGKDYYIEVDGGIKLETIDKALDAGANVIVAGTAVFGGDIEKSVKELLR